MRTAQARPFFVLPSLAALISVGVAQAGAPIIQRTPVTTEVDPVDQATFGGQRVVIDMRSPTKDTSTYANLGTGGNTREFVWMNYYPSEGRQSSLLVMFDTASAGAATGVDARRVRIDKATLTAVTFPSGPRATYDPSPDPWQSTLWPGGELEVFEQLGGTNVIGTVFVPADPRYIELDPIEQNNTPVELFAARFNNGLSAQTWVEASGGTPAFNGSTYNAVPIDFDETGAEREVFFSFGETAIEFVTGPFVGDDGNTYNTFYPTGNLLPDPAPGFDPNPLALGVSYDVPDGTPGQSIFGVGQSAIELGDELPPAHRLRFDVRVKDPAVQAYLRGSLEDGWASFVFSQLAFGIVGGVREYSYWLTKEGAASLPSAIDLDPVTLRLEYLQLEPGDLNGNGLLDRDDLAWQIRALANPEDVQARFPLLDTAALADMNDDGAVDVYDILDLAASIPSTPAGARRPTADR